MCLAELLIAELSTVDWKGSPVPASHRQLKIKNRQFPFVLKDFALKTVMAFWPKC